MTDNTEQINRVDNTDTDSCNNTGVFLHTTDDNVNSAGCHWRRLTELCRANNNKYRFKTDNGDYIIRYNELEDTYKV